MMYKRPNNKRSVAIKGVKTSISLEKEFHDALVLEAKMQEITISMLVAKILADSKESNRSSAVRVWLFNRRLQ